MNKVVLKPSFGMVFLSWLIICFVFALVAMVQSSGDVLDLTLTGALLLLVFLRSLILSAIFYLIPYYRIEVNDTEVRGPGSLWSWNHSAIPLANLEPRQVKAVIPWLGYYRLGPDGGSKIMLWWFGRSQLLKLLDAVSTRKGRVASPALAAH